MNAADNIAAGNYVTAAFDLLGVAGNVSQLGRACFSGEMLLDVEAGRKRADTIVKGDRLFAKNEFDPNGPVELKEVEEVFVRVAPILNVHVGGQVLRTTSEHPFWVVGKGWLNAGSLQIGDMLTTRDGSLVRVEGIADSGDVTTVYNWRIADHHTYFVSASADAASIWAHNAYTVKTNRTNGNAFRDKIADTFEKAGYLVEKEKYIATPYGKRFLDIFLKKDGNVFGALETKLGSSRYTPLQQLKDAWINSKFGWSVTVVRG